MKPIVSGITAGILAVCTAGAALAQSPYDDAVCRQYADQNTAALRAQAGNQAAGGALGGALLGAGIGAALGGGRGAAIGAGAGAITGGAAGSANAQATADYANQQYWAYYNSCMASRRPGPPPPAYGYPPQGPAYNPYAPYPGR